MSPKATFFLIVFFVVSGYLFGAKALRPRGDNGIANVQMRNAFEREGKELAEAGKYREAIASYQKAILPEYVNMDHEKSTAMGSIAEIYKWLGEYDKALETARWFLRDVASKKPTQAALEKELEILLLKKYQNDGNAGEVLDFITELKKIYQPNLPPQGYSFGAVAIISDILRLYNHIGDHDAGIKFIDDCVAYFKRQDIEKYGEYRPGKTDLEYQKVREGFERDKAEGFRGCAQSPPGVVCMGHATRALIESKYFPW